MIPYAHANRDVLTAREVTDLFKAELEHELGLALAGYYDHEPDRDELHRGHRLFAEAYRMAQRPKREADLPPEERERLQAVGKANASSSAGSRGPSPGSPATSLLATTIA